MPITASVPDMWHHSTREVPYLERRLWVERVGGRLVPRVLDLRQAPCRPLFGGYVQFTLTVYCIRRLETEQQVLFSSRFCFSVQ